MDKSQGSAHPIVKFYSFRFYLWGHLKGRVYVERLHTPVNYKLIFKLKKRSVQSIYVYDLGNVKL